MPRSPQRSADKVALIALAFKKTKDAATRSRSKLRADAPAVTEAPLLRNLPAALENPDELRAIETPQQREKARVKAAKRQQEDELWNGYQKIPAKTRAMRCGSIISRWSATFQNASNPNSPNASMSMT